MDLRTQYPRSLRDRLAGYVHLGRMIDKCRAVLAGTHGEYIFPCPLDRRLLEFSEIAPQRFLEAVKGRSDEEIAAWFLETARVRSPDEIERWNRMMLALRPDTDDKRAYFEQLRHAIDPTRTDVTTWADLLDLEERRSVPRREPG
ncbi:DUF5069 domain-containing protein [Candidatus Nitrospira bockiana]